MNDIVTSAMKIRFMILRVSLLHVMNSTRLKIVSATYSIDSSQLEKPLHYAWLVPFAFECYRWRHMVARIEHIENVIDTFARAVEANASTESRIGNLIELKAHWVDEVMVTADLHGDRMNFNKIRQVADLENHPRRHLILQEVCHGGPTYPTSGGCMSHMMLEDVARLKVDYPQQVHFLMSNHEMAELTDYPIVKDNKMLNLLFRFGMQEMYGAATDNIREAFVPFLRTLPLAVRVDHGIWISHTIPEQVDRRGFDVRLLDEEVTLEQLQDGTPIFEFVWGRDFRQENANAFADTVQAEVIINGHEPCSEGFATPNSRQIILDSHGELGSYINLPVGETLTQQDIVNRVKRLR